MGTKGHTLRAEHYADLIVDNSCSEDQTIV